MFRLSRQNSQMSTKDEGSMVEQHRALLDHEEDANSDLSDSDQFLTRGAFLLTPATELQMERVGLICEKMNYKGPFSLTKTATGILFKFAETEDYQLTFKKGFHKVTGSRFYKKIPIPCRPQKTFAVFAFEIPDDVPEEDIRHSLYKFRTVVEVCRLPSAPTSSTIASSSSADLKNPLKKSSIKWKDHYFYKMDKRERKRVCDKALRESPSFEKIDVDDEANTLTLYELMIEDLGRLRSTLVIRCMTVPTMYLYFDESNEQIVIFTEENEYIRRKFHSEIFDLLPRTCLQTLKQNPDNFDMRNSEFKELFKSQCQKSSKLETSLLFTVRPEKRLNICHAAKLKSSSYFGKVIFQNNRVAEAELYTFRWSTGEEEVRVSIVCPTSPAMYVYFQNLRENEDLHVLIVE